MRRRDRVKRRARREDDEHLLLGNVCEADIFVNKRELVSVY